MAAANESPLKIHVVSSVLPKPTGGGEAVLHRHLCATRQFEIESYGECNPVTSVVSAIFRRLLLRLERTRLARLAEDAWVLWAGRWIDTSLPSQIPADHCSAVLTVAHG